MSAAGVHLTHCCIFDCVTRLGIGLITCCKVPMHFVFDHLWTTQCGDHTGILLNDFTDRPHRRIQDFVRGGGARPSWPPGGGGKALLARASLFGGAIFCGEGGGARPPWPPWIRAWAYRPTVRIVLCITN